MLSDHNLQFSGPFARDSHIISLLSSLAFLNAWPLTSALLSGNMATGLVAQPCVDPWLWTILVSHLGLEVFCTSATSSLVCHQIQCIQLKLVSCSLHLTFSWKLLVWNPFRISNPMSYLWVSGKIVRQFIRILKAYKKKNKKAVFVKGCAMNSTWWIE